MTGIRSVAALAVVVLAGTGMFVGAGAQAAHASDFVPVTISGSVFEDRDGNGVYDTYDVALDDWMVYLFDGDLLVQYTATTGGTFTFGGVGPGTFTIQVDPPVAWVPTAAHGPNPVTTSSGEDVGGIEFGYFLLGSISGYVLDDHTGDGFSSDDTPFPAPVTIELFLDGGAAPFSAVTSYPSLGGWYSFPGLGPGIYTIQEVVPGGYTLTAQAGSTTYGYSGFGSGGNNFDNFFTSAITMLEIHPVESAWFAGNIARLGSADASSVATIDWGDGAVSAGTVISDPVGGFLVTGGHTYAEEGAYSLAVSVTRTSSSVVTGSEAVAVADAALHAQGLTLGSSRLTFSGALAAFTDDDPYGVTGDYSARIDWGDGTASTGTVTAGVAGALLANGSHAFAEGRFTVTTTVTDQGGALASAVSTITVDRTPPASTASVSGNVLNITASDNLSGIAATYYTVNGGPAQLYTGPIVLKSGKSTLRFWSLDAVGNTETAQTVVVKVNRP